MSDIIVAQERACEEKNGFNKLDALKHFLKFSEKSRHLSASGDVTGLLALAVKDIINEIGCERGTLYVLSKDELGSIFAHGVSKKIVLKINEKSAVGKCAIDGAVINIEDASKSKVHNNKAVTDFQTRELLSVPVKFQKEVIGVIQMMNTKDHKPFTGKEIDFLEQFALYFSSVLFCVKTIDELECERQESLQRLSLTNEKRDTDTGKHLKRIESYTEVLCESLKLADVAKISKASSLHDIGKVGISDLILLKPGKLTEEEREKMKQHTVEGARILLEDRYRLDYTSYFGYAVRIARHHHERWDGKGYPDGLVGERIPLEARITAVADVFDALTTKRPYKPAWDILKAKEEIERMSSSFFDPDVVDAFNRAWSEGAIQQISEMYKD